MVKSIDYPVDKLQLVINWINQIDPTVETAITEITKLVEEKQVPVNSLDVYFANMSFPDGLSNLGVAGGWNKIVVLNQTSPYWVIVGNDIQFTSGDLDKVNMYVKEHLDHVIMFANHGHSFFVLTQEGLKVGTFDENIYPAYLEDCDHTYRLKLLGLTASNIQDIHSIHGEAPTWGSSTIYSDKNYRRRNGETHGRNFAYYRMKWGGNNGEEKYIHPYDDENMSPSQWVHLPIFRDQNNVWGS
jgi:GT2 family glycosyltransferase